MHCAFFELLHIPRSRHCVYENTDVASVGVEIPAVAVPRSENRKVREQGYLSLRPAACRSLYWMSPAGTAERDAYSILQMSEPEVGQQPSGRDAPARNNTVEAVQSPPAQLGGSSEEQEQVQAAQLIQKNYRGYRSRRQMQGMGLDANSRWSEVRSSFVPCDIELTRDRR